MEDISRDLEREIAQAKPKLPKKPKNQHILVVASDGSIRSGSYLRSCIRLLLILTVIIFSAGLVLYYMNNTLRIKNAQLVRELDNLGVTYQDLLQERENLMARLILIKKDLNQLPPRKKKPGPPPPKEKPDEDASAESAKPAQAPDDKQTETGQAAKPSLPEIVTIQKFSIQQAPDLEKLIVQFDIRNVSQTGADITGRLFAALKPKKGTDQDWLIVPQSPVKDGIPANPTKGQSFSISQFKPVSLSFQTNQKIEFFREAAVFVFDEKGQLITESVFGIDQKTINDD